MTFIDNIWNLAGWLADIAIAFASALWAIISMAGTLISILLSFISFLPASWVAPIAVGLSIFIIYAIYAWVKDISIAGFKI